MNRCSFCERLLLGTATAIATSPNYISRYRKVILCEVENQRERKLCRTLHYTLLLDFIRSTSRHRGTQWQRGLGHELSSPARALGSWVQIALKAWMSVYVYFVCVM
jgi:hypothetical protein